MSQDNDNFNELKQMLKLKQHEVPPPGYFNRFSGDVISRIRAGETGGSPSLFEQWGSGSFLSNLLHVFQAKPGVIGGFATSLCLLLLFGVVMADRSDGTLAPAGMDITPSIPNTSPELARVSSLMPVGDESGITISTNSGHVLQAMPAMFGSQQNPLFQTVNFMQPAQ